MNRGRDTSEGKGSLEPRERGTDFEVPYARENIQNACAHKVRFRLTASVHRTNLKAQKKQWKTCLEKKFLTPKMFRDYTARQAKLHARTLTLTENASAIPVKSGKSMTWERGSRRSTSV